MKINNNAKARKMVSAFVVRLQEQLFFAMGALIINNFATNAPKCEAKGKSSAITALSVFTSKTIPTNSVKTCPKTLIVPLC